jgi:hypothetical protein
MRCRNLTFYGDPHLFAMTGFSNTSDIAHHHPELVEFCVNSSFLFTPFALPYTIHTLNTSPITTLTLTKTLLDPNKWESFLRKIKIETLEKLRIDSEVTVKTLYDFISNTPHLERLHIQFGDNGIRKRIPLRFRPARIIRLPKLTMLTGPADYLSVLLKGVTLPTKLHHLDIYSQADSCDHVKRILQYSAHCTYLEFLSIAIPEHDLFPIPKTLLSQIRTLWVYCLSAMTADFSVSFTFTLPFTC